MKHENITGKIIGVFYDVYNELGHGFLESVYKESMVIALSQVGLKVEKELPLKVWFRNCLVGDFRPDLIVENVVIVELKASRNLDNAHIAQLLNYLRATDIEIGLLLNFGPKPEIKRMIFDNEEKKSHGSTLMNTDQITNVKNIE